MALVNFLKLIANIIYLLHRYQMLDMSVPVINNPYNYFGAQEEHFYFQGVRYRVLITLKSPLSLILASNSVSFDLKYACMASSKSTTLLTSTSSR